MAIKGKKSYLVYLDKPSSELVKSFIDEIQYKGGFSGLINEYIVTMAETLEASGYEPGKGKVSLEQLIQLGKEGLERET